MYKLQFNYEISEANLAFIYQSQKCVYGNVQQSCVGDLGESTTSEYVKGERPTHCPVVIVARSCIWATVYKRWYPVLSFHPTYLLQ